MSPLRVAIVDDEEPARRLLQEYLSELGDVIVVAQCANGFEAVKAVAEHEPDLVLLDIQMPKLDGFEVVELLDPDTPVVFVTAYDEYALRAFEVHAVDYLLKPFSRDRLEEALARARVRLASRQPSAERAAAAEVRRQRRPVARLLTRDGARIHVVPCHAIDYLEAQDDWVCIVFGGKRVRKATTMAELEDQLDPARFVRIHRTYILNVERLARLELYAKDSRIAILADGTKLPVSRAGYVRLRAFL